MQHLESQLVEYVILEVTTGTNTIDGYTIRVPTHLAHNSRLITYGNDFSDKPVC